MKQNRGSFLMIYFLLVGLTVMSCQKQEIQKPTYSTFIGDDISIKKAEDMFSAIGGKQKWCALRSLYIKAVHEEPELKAPYTSEIWRGIDSFQLAIKQVGPEFHNLAYVDDKRGQLTRVHRDTSVTFSKARLAEWKTDHKKNIYVLLRKFACPGNFDVQTSADNEISFSEKGKQLCAFRLDEENRPATFITYDKDKVKQISRFLKWDTTAGHVHSAGGGPMDGSFSYVTQVWQPTQESFSNSFPSQRYTTKEGVLKDMHHVVGTWFRRVNSNIFIENWTSSDSELIGYGGKIVGTDTIKSETVTVIRSKSDLIYYAMVVGQNDAALIPFAWTYSAENKHVFSNLSYDFPQYISYDFQTEDTMQVQIWNRGQNENKTTFNFYRQRTKKNE